MEAAVTQMWDCLAEQDGETVLRLFTDYYGLRLLDEGFREHLVQEGYLEEESDEELEEEPEEDSDSWSKAMTALREKLLLPKKL
jgi:hypothetical protein